MIEVYVVIPAHNEAGSITQTIESIHDQTCPVTDILVIADRCSDDTESLASEQGAWVIPTRANQHMKAGALNQGLDELLDALGDSPPWVDRHHRFVLVMDADSHLAPGFVSRAVSELRKNRMAGAICATFTGEDRDGIIHSLQRNEYVRFARSISRRKARAQVLSGVATLFPVAVLREVLQARQDGRLPAAPGVYEVTAATEDIEMTYAVRRLGYSPRAPKECLAYTDTMPSWTALVNQRIRWQRGMLDALRLYGLNRMTFPYAARLGAMYFGSFGPLVLVMLELLLFQTTGHFGYSPVWLAVLPLFSFERWWTVRKLGREERLLALLLAPEWIYENFRAVVYWVALIRWMRRTERVWIPT